MRLARPGSLDLITPCQLSWWGVLAGEGCWRFLSISRNPSPHLVKDCLPGPSDCVAGAPSLPGVGRPARPQGKGCWGSSHRRQLTGWHVQRPCSPAEGRGPGRRWSQEKLAGDSLPVPHHGRDLRVVRALSSKAACGLSSPSSQASGYPGWVMRGETRPSCSPLGTET